MRVVLVLVGSVLLWLGGNTAATTAWEWLVPTLAGAVVLLAAQGAD